LLKRETGTRLADDCAKPKSLRYVQQVFPNRR